MQRQEPRGQHFAAHDERADGSTRKSAVRSRKHPYFERVHADDNIPDPFAAIFGSGRSSNPTRARLRFIAEPGLNVTVRKTAGGFGVHGPEDLKVGTELTFRTQFRDETLAVRSARKQLRRRHPRERRGEWEVREVSAESKVATEL
jgi:hypothetical protein